MNKTKQIALSRNDEIHKMEDLEEESKPDIKAALDYLRESIEQIQINTKFALEELKDLEDKLK